ncbi:uncharacterized protein LOC135144531 [Zophobas morio]|uniref:uncharacterized protein LOC135144531 n=1 Tax=Zophobas morio TaxID=2755281 RepID=UPI0030839844
MKFWGVTYLLFSLWLVIFVREDSYTLSVNETSMNEYQKNEATENLSIWDTYKTLFDVIKMKHMLALLVVLLVQKIGFMANDAVTPLLLIEKGFKREDMALTVLLDFPCQLVLGYLVAKWSTGTRPTRPWMYALVLRLIMGGVCMYVVYIFPPDGRVTPAYFLLVTAATLLTSFGTTAMFVSQGAFFARISDSKVGGSYQTLLATCSNFGGTWPKYFVLKLVDHFTIAKCSTTGQDCVTELGKAACRNSFASDQTPGVCLIIQEGFYYVSLICIICGSLLYLLFVRPTAKYLERLDVSVWKISN